jgi:hypothetical protein
VDIIILGGDLDTVVGTGTTQDTVGIILIGVDGVLSILHTMVDITDIVHIGVTMEVIMVDTMVVTTVEIMDTMEIPIGTEEQQFVQDQDLVQAWLKMEVLTEIAHQIEVFK